MSLKREFLKKLELIKLYRIIPEEGKEYYGHIEIREDDAPPEVKKAYKSVKKAFDYAQKHLARL